MKTHVTGLPVVRGVILAIVASLLLQQASVRADIVPPPRLLTQPVKAPGLRVFAYFAGPPMPTDPSLHFGIRTATNTGYSWVDAAVPVTYSLTITDCPAGSAQIILVAETNPPANAFMPAYTESNVIRLAIQSQSNGAATATLGLKVNSAPAAPPALASIASAEAKGTWKLTLDGLQATVEAPDGVQTNVDLPGSVLSVFADPVFVYFGGPGDELTLSRVQISGIPSPIDENFVGTVVDPTLWRVCTSSYSTVVLVPRKAKFWLVWPRNTTVRLQSGTTIEPASAWQDFEVPTNHLDVGSYQQTPICPDTTNRFFRAIMHSSGR